MDLISLLAMTKQDTLDISVFVRQSVKEKEKNWFKKIRLENL